MAEMGEETVNLFYRLHTASPMARAEELPRALQREALAVLRTDGADAHTPDERARLEDEATAAHTRRVRVEEFETLMATRDQNGMPKLPPLLGHPEPLLDKDCENPNYVLSNQVLIQPPSLACTDLSDKAEDVTQTELGQGIPVSDFTGLKSTQLRLPRNAVSITASNKARPQTQYRRQQYLHSGRQFLRQNDAHREAQYAKLHMNTTREVRMEGPEAQLITPGQASVVMDEYAHHRVAPPLGKITHAPLLRHRYNVTNVRYPCEVRALPDSLPPVVLTPIEDVLKPGATNEDKISAARSTLDTISEPNRWYQPSPDVSMPSGQPFARPQPCTEEEVAGGVTPRSFGDVTQMHLSYTTFRPMLNPAHVTNASLNAVITTHCDANGIQQLEDEQRNELIKLIQGNAEHQKKPWDLAVHDMMQVTLTPPGQAGGKRVITDPAEAEMTMDLLLKNQEHQPAYTLSVATDYIHTGTMMRPGHSLGDELNSIEMDEPENRRPAARLKAVRDTATEKVGYTPYKLRSDDAAIKEDWEGEHYVSLVTLTTFKGEAISFTPDSIIQTHSVEQQLTDAAMRLISAGPEPERGVYKTIAVYDQPAFEDVFVQSLGCSPGYNWLDIKNMMVFASKNEPPNTELRRTLVLPFVRSEPHEVYVNHGNDLQENGTFRRNQLANLNADIYGTGQQAQQDGVRASKPLPFLSTTKGHHYANTYDVQYLVDRCNPQAQLALNRLTNNGALILHCLMIIAQTQEFPEDAAHARWCGTCELINRQIDQGLKAGITNSSEKLVDPEMVREFDRKQLDVNASQQRPPGVRPTLSNAPTPMLLMQMREVMMQLAVERASDVISEKIMTNRDLTQNDVQAAAQQCAYLVSENIRAEASTQLKRLRRAGVDPALLKLDSANYRFYDLAHDSGRAVAIQIMLRHASIEVPMPVSDHGLYPSKRHEYHTRTKELDPYRMMTYVLKTDEMPLPPHKLWVGSATTGLPALAPISYVINMPDVHLLIPVVGKYTDGYTHNLAQIRGRVNMAPDESIPEEEAIQSQWGQPYDLSTEYVKHTLSDEPPPQDVRARRVRYGEGLPLYNKLPTDDNNAQPPVGAMPAQIVEVPLVPMDAIQRREERRLQAHWDDAYYKHAKVAHMVELHKNQNRQIVLHEELNSERPRYEGNFAFGAKRPGTLKDRAEELRPPLSPEEREQIRTARARRIKVNRHSASLAFARTVRREMLHRQQHNALDEELKTQRESAWASKLKAVLHVTIVLRDKGYDMDSTRIDSYTYDLTQTGQFQVILPKAKNEPQPEVQVQIDEQDAGPSGIQAENEVLPGAAAQEPDAPVEEMNELAVAVEKPQETEQMPVIDEMSESEDDTEVIAEPEMAKPSNQEGPELTKSSSQEQPEVVEQSTTAPVMSGGGTPQINAVSVSTPVTQQNTDMNTASANEALPASNVPSSTPAGNPNEQSTSQLEQKPTVTDWTIMTPDQLRRAVKCSNDAYIKRRPDHAAMTRRAMETLNENNGHELQLARQVLGMRLLTEPEEAIDDMATLTQLMLMTATGLGKRGLPVPHMWVDMFFCQATSAENKTTPAQLKQAQVQLNGLVMGPDYEDPPDETRIYREQAMDSDSRTPFTQATSAAIHNQQWKGPCPAEYLTDDRGCCGHRPGEAAVSRGPGFKYRVHPTLRIETTVPNDAPDVPGAFQREDIGMDKEMCGYIKPLGCTMIAAPGDPELDVSTWVPALPRQGNGELPSYDYDKSYRTAYANAMMLCPCCYSPNHNDAQCAVAFSTRMSWYYRLPQRMPQHDLMRTALNINSQFLSMLATKQHLPEMLHPSALAPVSIDLLVEACDILLVTTPQIIAHVIEGNGSRMSAWLSHYVCRGLALGPKQLRGQPFLRLYRTMLLLRMALYDAYRPPHPIAETKLDLIEVRAFMCEGDDDPQW